MFVSDRLNEPTGARIDSGRLLARATGAYLGLAVGDALGATVEFMTPREIQTVYGVHREMTGGGWLRLRRGQVTDDTEMSLALGNAILCAGRVEAGAIAAAFSDWMRGKPVDIGHTVRRGISLYRRTGCTEVPENAYDAGNGACMRSLPIALCTLGADAETVARANCIQSHTTHRSPRGDAGTLTVIRMTQAALLGGGVLELKAPVKSLIASEPDYGYDRRRQDNPGGYLVETLRAVFQSLFDTDNFEDALIDVVNRGGDADTTGAILGMIAGARYGIESIPARWLKNLEPGISAACRAQAQGLLRLSPYCQAF